MRADRALVKRFPLGGPSLSKSISPQEIHHHWLPILAALSWRCELHRWSAGFTSSSTREMCTAWAHLLYALQENLFPQPFSLTVWNCKDPGPERFPSNGIIAMRSLEQGTLNMLDVVCCHDYSTGSSVLEQPCVRTTMHPCSSCCCKWRVGGSHDPISFIPFR